MIKIIKEEERYFIIIRDGLGNQSLAITHEELFEIVKQGKVILQEELDEKCPKCGKNWIPDLEAKKYKTDKKIMNKTPEEKIWQELTPDERYKFWKFHYHKVDCQDDVPTMAQIIEYLKSTLRTV